MKFAAIFLRNKKVYSRSIGYNYTASSSNTKRMSDVLDRLASNIKVVVYCIFGVSALSFFLYHMELKPSILFFATNFRQAEESEMSSKDLAKIYSIYNKDNYILSKEYDDLNDKKIDKDKTNNSDNNFDSSMYASEYEILDEEARYLNEEEVFRNSRNDINVEITKENSTLQRISVGDINILNYSSKRDIDFKSFLDFSPTFTKSSDKILLYNTHTSESYANSDNYQFEYTGNRRSTDANYNVLCVANELRNSLLSKGFNCVHDTTPHDYGTYTSSYSRSRITVKNALEKMGGASISVDVHRDAIEDLDYSPEVEIKGVTVAQLMIVMGVGSDTTPNPNYEDNLKLALRLQQIANKVYPGLFKPMIIRNSVYNQDLNKYSLLIEVGASGNTIDEAKLATRCLANLLNIMYKD